MKPLELIIFEFLLGYVLQGFAIVLGIFVFNRQKIVFRSYIIASGHVIIISYLVRLLPISFGVHTVLNVLFLFLICVIVLKMPAYDTVRSALLVTMLLLICEMADVAVMVGLLGKSKFESLMSDPVEKAIIGFPGAVFFFLLVALSYTILKNHNFTLKKKDEGEKSGSPRT
jgi:hypothetical protein